MSSVAILVAIAIVSTLMVTYWNSIKSIIKYRHVVRRLPSIPNWAFPVIGHTYLLVGDPSQFFRCVCDLADRAIKDCKAKISMLWLGPIPVVFVVHPEAAEVILRSSKHMEKSFLYTFLHPWLGTGLLTSGGEKWFQRRRLITPSFHFEILKDFLEVMNEQSQTMLKSVEEKLTLGKKVDLGKTVTLCALDIICDTAMGKTVNAQENDDSEYVKSLYRIAEIVQFRQKTPPLWPDFIFKRLGTGKEHDHHLHVLHSFSKSVINQRIKDKNETNIKRRMAFLDVLIHAKTEDGDSLSFSDIQEEVDTFMFEGHDTTAAAMTWCLYLLGRHPEIQRRVHDEIDEVLPGERQPDMEDLKKLKYLEQVIKEALRLYPSVPFYGRVTTEDCVMDGHVVPKGSQVAVFTYSIHRNPMVWHDPGRFDPDRFTKENCVGRHPYAYIPFSAGPRNCIGQKFAQMEEKVILLQLLRRYTITSLDVEETISKDGDLILRPSKPINFTIAKRSRNVA